MTIAPCGESREDFKKNQIKKLKNRISRQLKQNARLSSALVKTSGTLGRNKRPIKHVDQSHTPLLAINNQRLAQRIVSSTYKIKTEKSRISLSFAFLSLLSCYLLLALRCCLAPRRLKWNTDRPTHEKKTDQPERASSRVPREFRVSPSGAFKKKELNEKKWVRRFAACPRVNQFKSNQCHP